MLPIQFIFGVQPPSTQNQYIENRAGPHSKLIKAAPIITPSCRIEICSRWIRATFGDRNMNLLSCLTFGIIVLTIESSSFDRILVCLPKSCLTHVLVSQLDSLNILLFLDKHVAILKKHFNCYFRLLKSWGSLY